MHSHTVVDFKLWKAGVPALIFFVVFLAGIMLFNFRGYGGYGRISELHCRDSAHGILITLPFAYEKGVYAGDTTDFLSHESLYDLAQRINNLDLDGSSCTATVVSGKKLQIDWVSGELQAVVFIVETAKTALEEDIAENKYSLIPYDMLDYFESELMV